MIAPSCLCREYQSGCLIFNSLINELGSQFSWEEKPWKGWTLKIAMCQNSSLRMIKCFAHRTSIICIQTASILILWAICVFNHQSCNRFFFQLLCSLMKYFGVLRKDSGGNGRLFDWMVYQLADPLFFSLQATLSAEESLLMWGHVPSWGSTTSSFLPQIHTEALFIFINRLNDAYI